MYNDWCLITIINNTIQQYTAYYKVLMRLNCDTCLVIASKSTCCDECPFIEQAPELQSDSNRLKVIHKWWQNC